MFKVILLAEKIEKLILYIKLIHTIAYRCINNICQSNVVIF